jgi:methylase of polypeptide subunit release factors
MTVCWLDQNPSDPSITPVDLPREQALQDRKLRLLLLDDDPKPRKLLEVLNLPGTVLYVARQAKTAYSALLTPPFTYDAVFVDWRMDEWEPLSDKFIASVGLPDTVPTGGLFLRVLSGLDPDDAVRGGHAELLVGLASAQGALTIVTSIHIDNQNQEEIYRLRARGAHSFLPKLQLPHHSKSIEVRQLLLSVAASQRDKRLWRALPLNVLRSILKNLSDSSPEVLRAHLTRFDKYSLEERHQVILSLQEDNDPEYLIGSLAWLRQPRFFCAERLLTDAINSRDTRKDEAERIEQVARVLQPSLPTTGLLGGGSIGDSNPKISSRIQDTHRLHKLEADREFLHLVVAPDLRRIDYYSSMKTKPGRSAETFIEHLGTTFSPRLAAAIDQNGVWPALKLSKLRHLMRSPRDRRIVHQGPVAVRCAENVFGPSIDTLLLGHLLISLTSVRNAPLSKVRHAAEIGVGTGYLLCVLSAFAKGHIQLLIGSDISPRAVEQAQMNLSIQLSRKRNPPIINLALSPNGLTLVRENFLDLIFSNPPYLPEPTTDSNGRGKSSTGSAIAGEEVIRHILLEEGPRVLKGDGIILMVTSTLTEKMLQGAVELARERDINWYSHKMTTKTWVPLDLPEVQQDPEWVELLLKEEAEHVIFDADSPDYPLRHGIMVTAYSRDVGRISQLESYLRGTKPL